MANIVNTAIDLSVLAASLGVSLEALQAGMATARPDKKAVLAELTTLKGACERLREQRDRLKQIHDKKNTEFGEIFSRFTILLSQGRALGLTEEEIKPPKRKSRKTKASASSLVVASADGKPLTDAPGMPETAKEAAPVQAPVIPPPAAPKGETKAAFQGKKKK